MKVSGFTFIRNAIKLDYPIEEAIRSILPLCDEIVVAVGNSEDRTLELVKSIDPKIRIIETIWDDSLREGGQVLAIETNKAFEAISKDSDWAIYIQGDEVMHEDYYEHIREAMHKYANDDEVDGLLFNYRHFYGSYDYIGDAIQWYPKEIRIIKNNPEIYSFGDAQGFKKGQGEKLNVAEIDAYIHHYGWVKSPDAMQRKQESFHRLWHDDQWMEKNIAKAEEFDYSEINTLWKFEGQHPKVMQKRIDEKGWKFDHDISRNSFSFKERFKKWAQKITGKPLGEYQNYKVVR
ncbi:glycosyltransferase family 2 protein [bacterium SCSIO 12643]|nr:glycosyltransferase family 2 protein [bacterium SCSIO 12643]